MAYDIDGLKSGQNAPGATLETSDKTVSPAGLYEHPETKETIITKEHPLFGNTQSEGVVRAGFVFKRAAEPEEHRTIVEQILDQKAGSTDELKGIAARLRELEAEKATKDSDKEELAQLREEKRLRELKESSDAGDNKVDAVEAGEDKATQLVAENGKATDAAAGTEPTEKKGKK